MGHSKAEKAKTHKRIVAIAQRDSAKRACGVGIANLMKEAGLTVEASTNSSIRATT